VLILLEKGPVGARVFCVVAKTFRTYLPEHNLPLPPCLREWLSENDLAYFVSDVVDQLDLSAIDAVYEEEDRSQPPYHPRMMTKILIYGYRVGVFSSRKIQKRLVEDVAFRVLAAGEPAGLPDHPGFSQDSFAGAGRAILAGVAHHVGGLGDGTGPGGAGREQGKAKARKHKAIELRRTLRRGPAGRRTARRVSAARDPDRALDGGPMFRG
jgi:Transposase domain (DUF772)